MAMNLEIAVREISAAIKTEAVVQYPSTPNGPTQEDDFSSLAQLIAVGVIAGLQHILDNAETETDGEAIL